MLKFCTIYNLLKLLNNNIIAVLMADRWVNHWLGQLIDDKARVLYKKQSVHYESIRPLYDNKDKKT